MPDGDVVADEAGVIVREVQHRVVLDVGVMPDDDAVDVATQHRVIPNAGVIAERHVAHDHRRARDIHAATERRFFAEERVELLSEITHARIAAKPRPELKRRSGSASVSLTC